MPMSTSRLELERGAALDAPKKPTSQTARSGRTPLGSVVLVDWMRPRTMHLLYAHSFRRELQVSQYRAIKFTLVLPYDR